MAERRVVSPVRDPDPQRDAMWFSASPVYPQWQVCPVCEGRGTVAHDFYTQSGSATSTAREQCRTCRGRTVIPPPGFFGGPQPTDGRSA